ncbi:P-II family nitrogen regulator [Dehalobacterium formicoaceticum]|uniref:P-II family nitrogen regulator n=1 Tax=Dehalobacterium formicoaceticum TaxID=51515 RepID=UPI000B7D9065|nr:P-II family nitrogen regulator [Dehalobacterium formicoaceticum]
MSKVCNYAPLAFMVTIIDRGEGEKISQYLAGEGVTFILLTHGLGTADSKILNYLGLGETEKDILFSTMTLNQSQHLLKELNRKLSLDIPGRGIAFSIPMDSVCGFRAEKHLRGTAQRNGGSSVAPTYPHDLIIAIANRGFSEEVMEAAKSAQATGGTIIHARGSGIKEAEKFFGVTIQPEKDIILILTSRELRPQIMEAIAVETGPKSDANTIVFSLPVNDVVGIENMFKK